MQGLSPAWDGRGFDVTPEAELPKLMAPNAEGKLFDTYFLEQADVSSRVRLGVVRVSGLLGCDVCSAGPAYAGLRRSQPGDARAVVSRLFVGVCHGVRLQVRCALMVAGMHECRSLGVGGT